MDDKFSVDQNNGCDGIVWYMLSKSSTHTYDLMFHVILAPSTLHVAINIQNFWNL